VHLLAELFDGLGILSSGMSATLLALLSLRAWEGGDVDVSVVLRILMSRIARLPALRRDVVLLVCAAG